MSDSFAIIQSRETRYWRENMSHTINVADLTNQDVIHRTLLDIQSHGTSYALVQDGGEVAKFVPVEEKSDWVFERKASKEEMQRRKAAFARAEELSKRIAKLWNTNETAVEAVANDRR